MIRRSKRDRKMPIIYEPVEDIKKTRRKGPKTVAEEFLCTICQATRWCRTGRCLPKSGPCTVINERGELERLCRSCTMDRLGFSSYKTDAEAVLVEAKEVAAKKRRASSRLENLGIPEEELLRQQQELFAKARMEQEAAEQQQWFITQQQVAAAAAASFAGDQSNPSTEQDEYE